MADFVYARADGLTQDVMLSTRDDAVHKVDSHLRKHYGGVRGYCLAAGQAPTLNAACLSLCICQPALPCKAGQGICVPCRCILAMESWWGCVACAHIA